MNIFKIWHDLDHSDRSQVILTLLIMMFFSLVILYGFLVSRGHDVDYFKERLGLQEQRLNYMDQKLDKVAQAQHDQKEHVNEMRRMNEAQQRQLEDQQRWIEHWKNLPQLPKPTPKR